jgi:hypothetical protein
MSADKTLPKVLVIHNRKLFLWSYRDKLGEAGFIVKTIGLGMEAKEFLNGPNMIIQYEVVIIHKDIHEDNGGVYLQEIVELLHKLSEATRIGVVSGEYPNGSNEVKSVGADFYFMPEDIDKKALLMKYQEVHAQKKK